MRNSIAPPDAPRRAHADIDYRFTSRHYDLDRVGPLHLVYEVRLDPVSDDYLPGEMDAHALLLHWRDRLFEAAGDLDGDLVPISWFVDAPGTFEVAPYQARRHDEDFLTFFTWPVDAVTGQRVNWLTLPVNRKAWHRDRADKGGFITEATGWHPAALQPSVYLPSLMAVMPGKD